MDNKRVERSEGIRKGSVTALVDAVRGMEGEPVEGNPSEGASRDDRAILTKKRLGILAGSEETVGRSSLNDGGICKIYTLCPRLLDAGMHIMQYDAYLYGDQQMVLVEPIDLNELPGDAEISLGGMPHTVGWLRNGVKWNNEFIVVIKSEDAYALGIPLSDSRPCHVSLESVNERARRESPIPEIDVTQLYGGVDMTELPPIARKASPVVREIDVRGLERNL